MGRQQHWLAIVAQTIAPGARGFLSSVFSKRFPDFHGMFVLSRHTYPGCFQVCTIRVEDSEGFRSHCSWPVVFGKESASHRCQEHLSPAWEVCIFHWLALKDDLLEATLPENSGDVHVLAARPGCGLICRVLYKACGNRG
jgi:hypothetical protein